MIALYKIIVYIISLLSSLLNIYQYVLIIAIFLSWVRPDPYNPIVRFIYSITAPVLIWFQSKFRFLRFGMIDLSPLVVFLFIYIINNIIFGEILAAIQRIVLAR